MNKWIVALYGSRLVADHNFQEQEHVPKDFYRWVY